MRTFLAILVATAALPSLADTNPPPAASAETSRPFTTGTKGLHFGVPSGGGTTFGFSWFLQPNAALHGDIGMDWTLTGATDFSFSVELGYRMYLVQAGRLHGFLQPGISIARQASISTLAAFVGVGAEYQLLERFTISAASGLAFQIGNLGGTGSAAVKLGTATTAIYANFYFP